MRQFEGGDLVEISSACFALYKRDKQTRGGKKVGSVFIFPGDNYVYMFVRAVGYRAEILRLCDERFISVHRDVIKPIHSGAAGDLPEDSTQ